MTKTFVNFLKAALTLSVILFFISFYFLVFNRKLDLDPDSMMLTLLLVVFTGLASAILAVVLKLLHKKRSTSQ